jgi:adenylate kinase
MEKMLNIVLFGPPGAGKGTQSENLINKYGLVHLSTGDILRSEIARGTSLGRKAKEIMDRGELVGDDIVIGMIESKLDDNTSAKGFIFDGFPRTTAQAVALDDVLQKKGTGISGMLALEVNDEELVTRLLQRGKNSGRADDQNQEIIRRRIQEYNNKTLPLKNYYSEQGKFHSIDGIGSIDEIFHLLVNRIIFLNAEMDLTGLETDLEHLDLTIQDFEVADDIAPELLLEIDAIKRAEAEEAEEAAESKNKKSGKKSGTKKSPVKKKSAAKSTPKKTVKVSYSAPKKAVKKKVAAKPVAKKKSSKKASPKKSAIRKATVKKAASKKTPLKKVTAKKTALKKVSPKKAGKKAVKVLPKKSARKPAAKKPLVRKPLKKVAAKKATKKKGAKRK